jgi:hypothetical protein
MIFLFVWLFKIGDHFDPQAKGRGKNLRGRIVRRIEFDVLIAR